MFVSNQSSNVILTSQGNKSFKGVQKVYKPSYKFTFDNGKSIIVGKSHRFMCDGLEVCASSLMVGHVLLDANLHQIKVVKKEFLKSFELYDIVGVENSEFIADGLVHHNCEFLGSAYTVIVDDVLERLFAHTKSIIPIREELEGRLKIYELPLDNVDYIIGVDPSKGTGKHDACIQIMRILSFEPTILIRQVAVFKDSTTDPFDMARILNRLCIKYNNAYIACEGNGEGSALVTHLWHTFNNRNLYNHSNNINSLGITANTSTKSAAVTMMKKMIENGYVELNDLETVNQLSTYIEDKSGKTHGQAGQPDDLVSALYWTTFMFTVPNFFENAIEIHKRIPKEEEEEIWGFLHDVDDNLDIDQSNWIGMA